MGTTWNLHAQTDWRSDVSTLGTRYCGPPFLQEIWVSLPSRPEDKILLETNRFLGTLSLRKDFLGVTYEQAQGEATKQDWCPGCPRGHLVLQRSQWPGQVLGEGWAGGEARTAILQAPDAKHS